MAENRLSKIEITLHWVVGIGIILMLIGGQVMERVEDPKLVMMHKSMGTVLFVFIIWRVIVRWKKGWPKDVSTGAAWEHKLARVIHWVLIVSTVLMPLSGILGSILTGFGLNIFGFELIGMSPIENGRPLPISKAGAGFFHEMHEIVSKILLLSVLLHIAGALKHHYIDKDNTLKRMLGR